MGKRNYFFLIGLFLGLILALVALVSPQKASAVDSDIVINEVMANATGDDSGKEWLEILNFGTASINLKDWQLKIYGTDTTSLKKTIIFEDFNLDGGEFLVVVSNADISKPCDSCLVYNGKFGSTQITNSKGRLSLINALDSWQYDFYWDKDVGDGYTMEITGPPDDPDYQTWHSSLKIGGTPGSTNSKVYLPDYPDEILSLVNLDNTLIYQVQVSSIVDGDTIKVTGLDDFSSTIRLLLVDTPEEGQPFYGTAKEFTSQLLGQMIDLVISQDSSEQLDLYNRTLGVVIFQDEVFNVQLLEQGLASIYDSVNSVIIKDAWMEILQQAQEARIGLWATAGQIIFSELLPNPVGDDSLGEWIELYNPTNLEVVLAHFLLDQYTIPSGTAIPAGGFFVFPRSQTGVVLNNSGDFVKFSYPGGLLIDQINYNQSNEGDSWALINNSWYWTTKPTPGAANILEEELADAGGDNEENLYIPINSEPIKIKTGEFRNFENYLVTITGTVVETSGNTFYLDDGSGKAKVYIQSSKDIDKPPMHKGDIFQITGIVNLYRQTWRILPQKQDDIKLIQAAEGASTGSSVIKKASAKSASTKSPTTSTTARSPTSAKKVASSDDFIQVEGVKTPWWIQVLKTLTGLTVICLALMIIKIIRISKEHKSLGGDFGDET